MNNVGLERRRWPRTAASSLGLVSAAIVAGPDAALVNLSRGGVLLEVAARLPLRTSVRLKFTQADGERMEVAGRIAWAKVAGIVDGQITYRVAVEFEQPIPALPGVAETDQDESPLRASFIPWPAQGASDEATSPDFAQIGGSDDADKQVDELSRKLAAASADLACQTALVESLAAKLKASEEFRDTSRITWEAERRQWEEERTSLTQQVAEAAARSEVQQTTLDRCEREHQQSLGELQRKYEVVVAELTRATNEQQAEYHALLEELAAAHDEQRSRAERHEADLERFRAEVEAERAEAETRRCELEARLGAAETVRAAQEARFRALRRETEKLLSMFTVPLRPESHPGQNVHSTVEDNEESMAAFSDPVRRH